MYMMKSQKSKVKSLFLVLVLVLSGICAHGQGKWIGVTGPAQKNDSTGVIRWNFGNDGLFTPATISYVDSVLSGAFADAASLTADNDFRGNNTFELPVTFNSGFGMGTNNLSENSWSMQNVTIYTTNSGTDAHDVLFDFSGGSTGYFLRFRHDDAHLYYGPGGWTGGLEKKLLMQGDAAGDLGYTAENASNKATSFSTLNNTLYTTTQSVANYVTGLGYITSSAATIPTFGGQTIAPTTGRPYTTYANSAYTAKVVVGGIGDFEANLIYNMDYNTISGVHLAFDPTLGAMWRAQGPYGYRDQYAPGGIPQTGIGNFSSFAPGSGGTPGAYIVNATGGTGNSEVLHITVNGSGNVSAVTSVHRGNSYAVNDIVSAVIPGLTGFTATVGSLYTDIWYASNQPTFSQGDIATNTLNLMASGNYVPPALGAAVQVQRGSYASMAGTTVNPGFILDGNPIYGTAGPVWINPDNTGTTFISGGNGSVQFGSIATISPQVKYNFLGSMNGSSSTTSVIKFGSTVAPQGDGETITGVQLGMSLTTGSGAATASAAGTTSASDGTVTAQTANTLTGAGVGSTWTVTTVSNVATVITRVVSGSGYVPGDTFNLTALPGITFTVLTNGNIGTLASAATINNFPLKFQSISPTNLENNTIWFTASTAEPFRVFVNSTTFGIVLQTGTATSGQGLVATSGGQFTPTTGTGSGGIPVWQTSPTFAGAPATPTPASNVNTTQIVNGAWTNTYFAALASNNTFTGTNTFNGKINFSTAANGPTAFATLVAGTVTVSNTSITANSIVFLTRKTSGGTVGTLSYTVSAGISFTITSSSSTDTSTLGFTIIN